jgi:hypothetical protein
MGISRRHVPYYKEVMAPPGFLASPTLIFGFHRMTIRDWPSRKERYPEMLDRLRRAVRSLSYRLDALRGAVHPDLDVPEEYLSPDLVSLVRSRGIGEIEILDLFDRRATLRHDMNSPIPAEHHERYGTLMDIGCLEHVFDTRQCLENGLRMVRTGGHLLLHTCVNGYYRHGLHVFNPEALLDALTRNGFEIVLERYSTRKGGPIADPSKARDVIIWLVARKTRELGEFQPPQQGKWRERYAGQRGSRRAVHPPVE